MWTEARETRGFHGPSRGATDLYRWPTSREFPLILRTGGTSMPYVTKRAAHHGVRAETREAGEDAPSHLWTCPTADSLPRFSRTTRTRPPFDLVAAQSPDAPEARILIWDRRLVPTCAHVRVRSRPSQTWLGKSTSTREQPSRPPSVTSCMGKVEVRDWPSLERPKSIS